MSLRRSARVASTNTSELPDAKSKTGGPRYEKVLKSNATTKKPKPTKAGATLLPADTAKEPTTKAKSEKATDQSDSEVASEPHPATPLPKKRKSTSTAGSPVNPPPFTPTPAAVAILSKGRSESDHPLEDLSQFHPRPAEPHATNATLATPNGSHTVQAYGSSPAKPEDPSPARKRKAKELVPPDVGAIPNASTDIDRLLKDAEAHLVGVDPTLKGLVEKHHCKIFSPEGLREIVDPFTALSSGIIGQQVCPTHDTDNVTNSRIRRVHPIDISRGKDRHS